ncbi:MAG: outer membrane beta-barrel protein [Pseudomonadota bacterium]
MLAATATFAGQIEREGNPALILYEAGDRRLELAGANVNPSMSGTFTPVPGLDLDSRNIQESYQQYSLGLKYKIDDRWTLAALINQPVGADVKYAEGRPHPFSGAEATIEALAINLLAKYQATDRISVFGGLRAQRVRGDVSLPPPFRYELKTEYDEQFGYVVGAAFEIQEILLRVAATYESEVTHSFSDNNGAPFDVVKPQAFTLNLQSGINQKTLAFASARWRDWTEFQIAPPDFGDVLGRPGAAIAFGTSDIWTFEVGIGRRITDRWSGIASIKYEEDLGDTVGNLLAYDGFISYGLAAVYRRDKWDVIAGVRYVSFGDTRTTTIGADFEGNSAVATGLRVAYRF